MQEDKQELNSEVIENQEVKKEIIIGKYKPKKQFISFLTGLKGRIRLLSNYAFIKGEQLSGMLEGAVFKITICDENTINFEEVDTTMSTPDMIERFIQDICDRDVTGYVQKFIVSGLTFYDDEAKNCYLEIEHKKPINMLFELFDKKTTEVSENGMSILDALFSSETDEELKREFEGESDEEIQKEVTPIEEIKENESQRMLRESFEKMNADKIAELKDRIEKTEGLISKLKLDIQMAESKITSSSDELGVLNTRLSSFNLKESAIGYNFYVSAENKTGIEPDESLVTVVNKIAPHLKLNTKAVIDMLTTGSYTIKIESQDRSEEEAKKDISKQKSIYSKIMKMDPLGQVKVVGDGEFEYRGNMTWHQLVGKMIALGFEQNPEFDKLCGSNSYESKENEIESQDSNLNGTQVTSNTLESLVKDGFAIVDTKVSIDANDEGVQEALEDFKSNNGYDMGDEFIFAIGYDNSDPNYPTIVSVTPKSYFDKEKCSYDQHITVDNGGVLNMPMDFEEVSESEFISELSNIDSIKDLITFGLKFDPNYQSHVENTMGVQTIGNLTVTDYIKQNYPNSIV